MIILNINAYDYNDNYNHDKNNNNNSGLDPGTTNLLQFAASVPVPDHSGSFMDLGLESFQSLYEDLGRYFKNLKIRGFR